MAKRKGNHSVAKQGHNQLIQTSYEEDDNLMPTPDLLTQYQQIDPDFIKWFKDRADLEQRSRIENNKERVELSKSVNRKLFAIDQSSIWGSIIVVLAFIAFAAYVVANGNPYSGVLIGGGAVLLYAMRLLGFRKRQVDADDKKRN